MQLRCDVSIAKNSFASLGIMLRKFGILWGCLCKSYSGGGRESQARIWGVGVNGFGLWKIVNALPNLLYRYY